MFKEIKPKVTNSYKYTYYFYVISFLITFFLLVSPIFDPDFGWHYRYGEIITTTFSIPKHDPFSYTYSDYSWPNSYWLAQIPIYLFSQTYGPIGIKLVFSFVYAVFQLWLIRRLLAKNKKDFEKVLNMPLTMAGIVLTLFCSAMILRVFNITVRPLFVSTVFFQLLAYILLFDLGKLKFLPFMFLVWANSHAGFVVGLFVFAIYLAFNFNWSKLFWFLFSFGVTFVNPYGYKLHETLLIKETGNSQTLVSIMEFLPLNVTESSVDLAYVLYFLVALCFSAVVWQLTLLNQNQGLNIRFVEIVTSQRSFQRFRQFYRDFGILWYPFVVAFMGIIGIRSVFFFRIFFVLGFFCMAGFLSYVSSLILSLVDQKFVNRMRIFGVCLILFLATIFLWSISIGSTERLWADIGGYPYDATEYMLQNDLNGRILSTYNWGGYLIYKLPQSKVAVDGRMPSWECYDDGPYCKFLEDFFSFEAFEDLLPHISKANADYILLPTSLDQVTENLNYKQKIEFYNSILYIL